MLGWAVSPQRRPSASKASRSTSTSRPSQFARVGAGIHAASNAVKVLLGLGLPEEVLREKAVLRQVSRNCYYDTGKITGELDLGEKMTALYGVRYTTWHRGDLHEELAKLVPSSIIHRGKKLIGIDLGGDDATMRFEDGTSVSADVVIGADGIDSVAREAIGHVDKPHFTGKLAYRTVIPREKVAMSGIDESCKWAVETAISCTTSSPAAA